MRHRNARKKLGRGGSHRKAMIRNLLTSLITHETIETTQMRCKMLKREMDKLITLGKKGTVHARRIAATRVYGREAVLKLFDEIAPRFEGRNGGYTRIMLRGPRRGDAGEAAIIQLLPADESIAPAKVADEETE